MDWQESLATVLRHTNLNLQKEFEEIPLTYPSRTRFYEVQGDESGQSPEKRCPYSGSFNQRTNRPNFSPEYDRKSGDFNRFPHKNPNTEENQSEDNHHHHTSPLPPSFSSPYRCSAPNFNVVEMAEQIRQSIKLEVDARAVMAERQISAVMQLARSNSQDVDRIRVEYNGIEREVRLTEQMHQKLRSEYSQQKELCSHMQGQLCAEETWRFQADAQLVEMRQMFAALRESQNSAQASVQDKVSRAELHTFINASLEPLRAQITAGLQQQVQVTSEATRAATTSTLVADSVAKKISNVQEQMQDLERRIKLESSRTVPIEESHTKPAPSLDVVDLRKGVLSEVQNWVREFYAEVRSDGSKELERRISELTKAESTARAQLREDHSRRLEELCRELSSEIRAVRSALKEETSAREQSIRQVEADVIRSGRDGLKHESANRADECRKLSQSIESVQHEVCRFRTGVQQSEQNLKERLGREVEQLNGALQDIRTRISDQTRQLNQTLQRDIDEKIEHRTRSLSFSAAASQSSTLQNGHSQPHGQPAMMPMFYAYQNLPFQTLPSQSTDPSTSFAFPSIPTGTPPPSQVVGNAMGPSRKPPSFTRRPSGNEKDRKSVSRAPYPDISDDSEEDLLVVNTTTKRDSDSRPSTPKSARINSTGTSMVRRSSKTDAMERARIEAREAQSRIEQNRMKESRIQFSPSGGDSTSMDSRPSKPSVLTTTKVECASEDKLPNSVATVHSAEDKSTGTALPVSTASAGSVVLSTSIPDKTGTLCISTTAIPSSTVSTSTTISAPTIPISTPSKPSTPTTNSTSTKPSTPTIPISTPTTSLTPSLSTPAPKDSVTTKLFGADVQQRKQTPVLVEKTPSSNPSTTLIPNKVQSDTVPRVSEVPSMSTTIAAETSSVEEVTTEQQVRRAEKQTDTRTSSHSTNDKLEPKENRAQQTAVEPSTKVCEHCQDSIITDRTRSHQLSCTSRPVSCEYCAKSFPFSLISSHELNCEEKKRSCRHCREDFPMNSLSEHENHCGEQLKQCPHCLRRIKFKEMSEHIQKCDCRLVSCPNECGGKYLNRSISKHLNVCSKRAISKSTTSTVTNILAAAKSQPPSSTNQSVVKTEAECKFCDELFPSKELESHQMICDWKPKRCSFCSMVIISRDLMRHERNCKDNARACPHCEEKVKSAEFSTHSSQCRKRPIKCIRCGVQFPAEVIEAHSKSCKENPLSASSAKRPPPPPSTPPPPRSDKSDTTAPDEKVTKRKQALSQLSSPPPSSGGSAPDSIRRASMSNIQIPASISQSPLSRKNSSPAIISPSTRGLSTFQRYVDDDNDDDDDEDDDDDDDDDDESDEGVTLAEVVAEWDVEDVCLWLKEDVGVAEVVRKFQRQQVNGKKLLELDDEQLKRSVGVSSDWHRNRILAAIDAIKTGNDMTESEDGDGDGDGDDDDAGGDEELTEEDSPPKARSSSLRNRLTAARNVHK